MNSRLYRSSQSKVIGGVSGGLGEYLKIDPVIIRIIFVLLTIFHGIGVVIYIIMWIIVPENPKKFYDSKKERQDNEQNEPEVNNVKPEPGIENNASKEKGTGSGRLFAGLILIILGGIFLAERFLPYFDFADFFPLLLIALGILLLANSVRK